MASLDLENLRAFVAVVDFGGFAAGARKLGRTQATVSFRIKRLEKALQCQLMLRSNRLLGLTPVGLELLGYARDILATADEALIAVKKAAGAGCTAWLITEAVAADGRPPRKSVLA
jgi:DNA-binding transcriptional LysR family regulator